MLNTGTKVDSLPTGRMLMINPPYPHFYNGGNSFIRDETPVLPLGPLYAGELIESLGEAEVDYFDCQLNDLWLKNDFGEYDSFGISVMGAQNLAPVQQIYRHLLNFTEPTKIFFGGQGVENLTPSEFSIIFPNATQVPRESLSAIPNSMEAVISRQADKFSSKDLQTYLSNELSLVLSQGCMYGCSFCAAQIRQKETFFNTKDNLEYLLSKARDYEIDRIHIYCTSLDFFQQALPGNDIKILIEKLEEIIELKEKYDIKLKLRALTRADSYIAATKSEHIWSLIKEAGFYKFGFGADGAASLVVLKAMRRGTENLRSDIISAFEHCQTNEFIPEMLYVFGVPEDTEKTLQETKDFCVGLLTKFPDSEYRGFPAKNEIPGNRNWKHEKWKQSYPYHRLLKEPSLFMNLGYETLVNNITHPNPTIRKLINKYAIEMSYVAHKLGRAQSFLTIPMMDTDGFELMDEKSFQHLIEIIKIYIPDISQSITLSELPAYRTEINRFIPKDK